MGKLFRLLKYWLSFQWLFKKNRIPVQLKVGSVPAIATATAPKHLKKHAKRLASSLTPLPEMHRDHRLDFLQGVDKLLYALVIKELAKTKNETKQLP